MRISYLNGKFLNHNDAFVHIEDRGFQFADGIYEVIFYKNSKLIDAKPHVERLFRSLSELNIKHDFSAKQILDLSLELFAKNNLTDGFIYMQITRGATNRVPNCPLNLTPTIVMTVSPAKEFSAAEFETGLSLMSHEDFRWMRCDIKSVGLIASSMSNQKARDMGFNDVLFVRQNIVTEGSFSNFFMVDAQDNLVTKNADNLILQGITRNRIIDLAREAKINVIERSFTLEETTQAKEAFLSSSTLAIRPVTKLDSKLIADGKRGKITRKLSELYQEFLLK